MKRVGLVLFTMLAVALLSAGALAQDTDSFFVTYYSNSNTQGAPDAAVRIINDGAQATEQIEGVPNGNLWASFYVFDDSQELQQCCNCFVSADGLLSESVNKQLANPATQLTGRGETSRGVIKVIASAGSDPTNNTPVPGLHGFATHIQATTNASGASKGPWFVTEAPLADAILSSAEQQALQTSCSYAITLGSGYGVCSCTPEDHDF